MKKWEVGHYFNKGPEGVTSIRQDIEADEVTIKDNLARFFRREEGHSHELVAIYKDFDFIRLKSGQ